MTCDLSQRVRLVTVCLLALTVSLHAQQTAETTRGNCIGQMEQELTTLSPQERAAPAYLATTRLAGHDALCDPFSTATDPNARRIVAENPDFYDRRLPPSASQVILLNLSMFNRNAPDQRGQYDRVADGMDIAALAELTVRR